MPALLSVIVVSYGNQSDLVNCLDSIERLNDLGEQLEIIVVEQTPSSYIYDYLKCRFISAPNRYVIRNSNKGFGAGNNAGVRVSTGKYLLFLNPDTYLVEPIFRYAVEQFNSNSNLGLFGLKLISADGSAAQSFYWKNTAGTIRGKLWKLFDRANLYLQNSMYITGADIFIRRSLFESLGCFDEKFFMYYEEADLCNRVRSAGYMIKYFPKKRIVHLEGKSSPSSFVSFERRMKSAREYHKKYHLNYRRYVRRLYINYRIKYFITKKAEYGEFTSSLKKELKMINHMNIQGV